MTPGGDDLLRILRLADHNTRVVVAGVVMLGAAAGVLGVFLLLRRRTLLVDTLGHATLPGISGTYLVLLTCGVVNKSFAPLLAGAATTGLLAVGALSLLARVPRVRPDAALAVVASSAYGLGVVLLSIAQQTPGGNAAGLHHFVYGKTASMITRDAQLIAVVAAAAIALTLLHFKELRLLAFDPEQARALGMPTRWVGGLSMLCTTAVAVVGLQAVGLILVVALFVAPAAAARCWSNRLSRVTVLAAVFGAGSAWVGAVVSALVPRAPTGALIVGAAVTVFAVSLLLGSDRGLWRRPRLRSVS